MENFCADCQRAPMLTGPLFYHLVEILKKKMQPAQHRVQTQTRPHTPLNSISSTHRWKAAEGPRTCLCSRNSYWLNEAPLWRKLCTCCTFLKLLAGRWKEAGGMMKQACGWIGTNSQCWQGELAISILEKKRPNEILYFI